MIAESSVLATSAWNSEVFKGAGPLDLFSEDYVFDNEEYSCNVRKRSVVDYDSLGGSSHTPSAASSECGDDFLVEICSSDINLVNWVNDGCGGVPLSEILETNFTDDLLFSPPTWSLVEEFPQSLMGQDTELNILPDIPNSPVRKHNKTIDPFTIHSWSELSSQDQVRTVEALSQIVSSKLGLREQLDVIRIIDPAAVITNSDTEFVIDLNCLDNEKWHAVRDYVKRAKNEQSKKSAHPSSNTVRQSPKSKNAPNSRRQDEHDIETDCPSEVKRKCAKKTTTNKEQKVQMKAVKQRQRKEYKQMMKERRSGLFVREEVLALSTAPLEEEIDILE